MRFIALVSVVLVVIVAICLISFNYISNSSQQMEQDLSKIEENINNKNWQQANADLTTFKEKWNGTKGTWSMIMDHQEIDNIAITLEKMGEYVKKSNQTLALGEIASLKLLIGHIPEKEELAWENIF